MHAGMNVAHFDFAVCEETPHGLSTGLQLRCKRCIICLRLELHVLIQLSLVQIHS